MNARRTGPPSLPPRTPAGARRAVTLALLGLAGACALGRGVEIIPAGELPQAGGAPSIAEIVDLGGIDAPANGELRPGRSDGVATIGELLWIRGRHMGRQPTVLVGGRPAAVLSRTEDGGILVRVPVRTPAGPQPVVVTQEHGRAERPITVRRYAALLPPEGGRVAWVELGPDGPAAAGSTIIPGARFLQLSAEGRAAYVLEADSGVLHVVEMPAPTLPQVTDKVNLGKRRVLAFAAAPAAHRVAVVGEGEVLFLDTSSPLRPVRRGPWRLPAAVRTGRVVRADLSPDGKRLALALAEGNRLLILDADRLSSPGDPVVGQLALLPDVRVPALVDLAFSHDAQTLWVLSGDTDDSRPVGPQPTQVHAVRLRSESAGKLALELARTVALPEAADPVRVNAGRALPLASGAAIRLPPEKATVYVSAVARQETRPAVFVVGAEDSAATLGASPAIAKIGGVDLTPDGRWLLGAALGGDGSFTLLALPADARPGPSHTLALVPATGLGGPASGRSEVEVQP